MASEPMRGTLHRPTFSLPQGMQRRQVAARPVSRAASVPMNERAKMRRGGFFARLAAYRQQRGNIGFDCLYIG